MRKNFGARMAIVFLVLVLCPGVVMPSKGAFAANENMPEFDGVYLQLNNGRFAEIKKKQYDSASITNRATIGSGLDLLALAGGDRIAIFPDSGVSVALSARELKGIHVRGSFPFQALSLNVLAENSLNGKTLVFSSDKINAAKYRRADERFIIAGKKIELRMRATGNDSYYYQPLEKLQSGKYVFSDGNSFWAFEVTDAPMSAASGDEPRWLQGLYDRLEASMWPTRPGRTFRDCADCPEMVVVPPGSFTMGSNDGGDDEKPVHQVTIPRSFGVSRTEVTVGQWGAFVSATGYSSASPAMYGLDRCGRISRDGTGEIRASARPTGIRWRA